MLKKFELEDSKPMKTPISTKTKLTKDVEGESVDNTRYRGMIGSLLYLMASRPDIMSSICLCARFQEDPKTSHLEAVKRIFQYVKGTTHLGLWYPKGSGIETIVYADSDHAGDYMDRKSTSGICTFMGCSLTSWFLKKQTALAISTTEAEYVSAGKACQQALWMKQALVDYGIRLDDIPKMCDNKWAIDLSKNPVHHSRTKHIEIRHRFLRDNVQKGNISIEKISSEVKQVNNVTRLQALVDKKKVVVTEAAIRECMSAKRTSWDEFSSSMASAVICLSTGDLLAHTTKYTSLALTQKVFANTRRVGKGYQEADEEEDADEHVEEVTAGDDAHGDDSAAQGEVPTITQEPSIPSPTPPPQPPQDLPSTSQVQQTPPQSPQKSNKVEKEGEEIGEREQDDESNQERMIVEMDKDDAVVLMDDKEEDKKVEEAKKDETEPAEVQEVVDVVTTAKLITEVVTAASETVTADEAIDHVKRKAKEDHAVKRYQVLKRKPQSEAQAIKNMIMYLKNVDGFKMDYFKGMSYDDICPIFEAKFNSNVAFLLKKKEQIEEEEEEEENIALQKINETPAERATKRRKLDEEVEYLKRHLEIVPNEDDDVYTKATPLARKLHERFSTVKPKNFSDDFLLTTRGAMFETPDAHAQIWKNQRSVHGQAKVKSWKLLESYGVQIITFTTTQLILLVERKYPLSRFTLDQILNAVRLKVEDESEVSLELLRFIRQQHQEGQLE
nr:hypothetical protein [Tanacetum cinerariifolium]